MENFNMASRVRNSAIGSAVTQLLLFTTVSIWCSQAVSSTPQELPKGFRATPDDKSTPFQSLLADSSGNFSLGFLRVDPKQLALAVVHVPSSETIWVANMTKLARWADPTELYFNGSLVLSDTHSGVFWSTETDGDRVWLSNTSDLQVQKLEGPRSILWQSFQFPSDTLVENQNFTSSMSLVSANGKYYMRLGPNFIGLYAKFNPGSSGSQMYWKHKALEAKASIIEGQGPIHAVISSDGYLGMYQNGSSIPVDVESFNSYQEPGVGVRRMKLESDGNLKGYYWNGSNWTLDYEGIRESCDLPSSCGLYGLCQSGKGCSCLDNSTDYAESSGQCVRADKNHNESGDFCSAYEGKYKILRRSGVELPYKELMEYQKMDSLEECEKACERECRCWGAVYSNSSGFCYMIEYPIQSLVSVGDESKVGYFKVREGVGNGKIKFGVAIGIGILLGAILVIGVLLGLKWYKARERKRYLVEEDGGGGVGPYKGLGGDSFRSIELSER